MIETKGLGAGSYPEPKEEKERCYKFEFEATINGYGVVYAEDGVEALELAINDNYDEIIETYNMKIQDVISLEIE